MRCYVCPNCRKVSRMSIQNYYSEPVLVTLEDDYPERCCEHCRHEIESELSVNVFFIPGDDDDVAEVPLAKESVLPGRLFNV